MAQPPPYPRLPVVLRELMHKAYLLKTTAQPSASLHNHHSQHAGQRFQPGSLDRCLQQA